MKQTNLLLYQRLRAYVHLKSYNNLALLFERLSEQIREPYYPNYISVQKSYPERDLEESEKEKVSSLEQRREKIAMTETPQTGL